MNRVFLLGIAIGICLFMTGLPAGPAHGEKAVFKICSDCHTSHFSQDGVSTRQGSADVTGTGTGQCADCHAQFRAVLLKLDCLGCHARSVSGSANIIASVPQIAHTGTDLAAGNYRYVFGPDYAKGHNVHGFGASVAPDPDLSYAPPPGYNSSFDPAPAGYDSGNLAGQLLCAGRNGCHGDRTNSTESPILSMYGSHHADDSVLKFGTIPGGETGQGTTVGKSYRFLGGIHGGEDSDWQNSASTTDHNEYKGQNNTGSRPDATIDTISEFCAECHGDFHGTIAGGSGASSPWVRHPTDIVLPATGEYTGFTTYNLTVPLGRQSIPNAAQSTVTPGSDVVICLSCHRAHASNFYKALRWDYKNGTLTGCTACHADM